MSNTKHTPGPWIVTTGKHTETTEMYDKGETWFNVNGEDGVIADVVFGRCLGTDEENAEANANLIAAAPELLEVTEAALPMYELIAKYVPQYYSAVEHERAKAAIKKATE